MRKKLLLLSLLIITLLPSFAATGYVCKYCGERFSSLSVMGSLKCSKSPGGKHVVYEGEETGPYTCAYCGERFSSLSVMGSLKCSKSPDGHHSAYEGKTSDKPYVCAYCGEVHISFCHGEPEVLKER